MQILTIFNKIYHKMHKNSQVTPQSEHFTQVSLQPGPLTLWRSCEDLIFPECLSLPSTPGGGPHSGIENIERKGYKREMAPGEKFIFSHIGPIETNVLWTPTVW